MRQIGNGTGTTFPQELLSVAGIERGDCVEVTAEPGRLVIGKTDTTDARARASLERNLVRYENAFRRLAR